MTTFNDTYEIKSIIGKGGMSTVYLAEHKRLWIGEYDKSGDFVQEIFYNPETNEPVEYSVRN